MEEEFKSMWPRLPPDSYAQYYNSFMNLEIEPSTLTKENIVEQR